MSDGSRPLKRARSSFWGPNSVTTSVPQALAKEVGARKALARKVKALLKGHEIKSISQSTLTSATSIMTSSAVVAYGGTSGAGFNQSSLCLTDEGDDVQNRNGRRDMPTKLYLQGTVQGAGASATAVRYRFIIVQDRGGDPNGAAPTWNTIMETSAIDSWYERDNSERFLTVFDSGVKVLVGNVGGSAYSTKIDTYKKVIDLKKRFRDANGIKRAIVAREYTDPVAIATPTTCVRGALWFCFASDAAGASTQAGMDMSFKLEFSDL